MAGVDDKITNGLLIWGNASAAASDLAVLTVAENGTTAGVQAGNDVYADVLNSGIRSGTILTYCLIEALKKGPSSDVSENATAYTNQWYDELAAPVAFDYKTQDASIGDFSEALHTVLNLYLKRAQTYFAIRANVWNHARNIIIKDADASHQGESVSVDGSQDYVFKLPSTIKATLDGSAKSVTEKIGGVSLSDIFVYDGQNMTSKAKTAAEADKAYVDKQNTLTAASYPLVLANDDASSEKDLKQRSGVQYNENTKALEIPGLKAPLIYGNYGVCLTAASTAAKTVDIQGFTLQTGATVNIKFQQGNTVSSPTLNVNGTGAKYLRLGSLAIVNNVDLSWRAGDVLEIVYDGTNWVICKSGPQLGYYGTCSTVETTVGKIVSMPGFTLEAGAHITVYFTHGNRASSATLNVNGTGAKTINVLGGTTVANQADPRSWSGGETCEFVYTGTVWRLIKPYAVIKALSADSASEAVSSTYADSANSAVIAQKIGNSSIGDYNSGIYLVGGTPSVSFSRVSAAGSLRAYKAAGSGTVTSLSFSQLSDSSGLWYFSADCWQKSLSTYHIEADLTITHDLGGDEWLRIDLKEIIKTFFSSGGYADFTSFSNSNYWTCVATFRRDRLYGTPSQLVTYTYYGGSTTGYAYVGCDTRNDESKGVCAHVSFDFVK